MALLTDLRSRITCGMEALERGQGYTEAARLAGYADAFQFSRAVTERLGMRPRAALATDWRALLEKRTAHLFVGRTA